MIKRKTTINEVKSGFDKVFACGYCDLSYIMYGVEPIAYNSGVYGWNWDLYSNLWDVSHRDNYNAIITGYRNLKGLWVPDEIIERYTNEAKSILAACDEITDPNDKIWARVERLQEMRKRFWAELDNL